MITFLPYGRELGRLDFRGAVICLAWMLMLPLGAEESQTPVDPKADAVLRRMGGFLAAAPFFTVTADVWQDSNLASGQRVQSNRSVELKVRRPDRFHSEVKSATRNRALYYDGTSLTLVNHTQRFFGTVAAPATLDAALDLANERFGIAPPLEDLLVADPYRNAIGKTISGIDLGVVSVLGVPCEHLAFSRGSIDWQIWIELGASPVPRRMVITYRDESGWPEYVANFSDWDFKTPIPDAEFVFHPEAAIKRIDVAEVRRRNQKPKEGKKP